MSAITGRGKERNTRRSFPGCSLNSAGVRRGSNTKGCASSSCSKAGTLPAKGGTIRALTERVSPRVFRLVALPAPSDREKSQMYMQRYMQYFPGAGEIVIFDRSWCNRAGVEYVMGFCPPEQHNRFLELCPVFERYIVQGGIILIKYWMEVGKKEQQRRFDARIKDPLRQWKLSPMDLESFSQPLVRVFSCPRSDAQSDGHENRTLVHRALG
jgi:hypothetical protein